MSKLRAFIAAMITMVLWGSLFPTVKMGFAAYGVVGTADVLLFAGLRFVICGGIICIIAIVREQKGFIPRKSALLQVLASGLFAITLHYAFTYSGLQSTDSSKTALIKQIGSLLYICFSFLFIKEDKPTVKKTVAALVGFCGIIALNISTAGFSFRLGDLLILCASFCTVFSNVISKRALKVVSPLVNTGISQLFGGAILLAAGLIMGGEISFKPDSSIFIMIYICLASIVSYCLWFTSVKSGELSGLFIIKFAEPVFACIFGAILLDENIWRIQYLVAFIMISGSIWLAGSSSPKKQS